MELIRITDNTIKNSWTLYIITLSFLALILVRVGITVSPSHQNDPIYVEGNLEPPQINTKVEPVYPEQAKKAGITGEILLEVLTNINGNVVRTKVLNIQPSFEQGFGIWHLYIAAREAVSQWTFRPFYFNGQRREAVFTVAVNFE